MKEELTIKVEITATDEVRGNTGIVRMIRFTGTADCDNFKGRILPGGIDTQKEFEGKPFLLSARYMLDGIDKMGQTCRIFIENNGESNQNELVTTPKIITDSAALSYLETTGLTGTIEGWEKGVIIHIFS
jgi:hypothetical protein